MVRPRQEFGSVEERPRRPEHSEQLHTQGEEHRRTVYREGQQPATDEYGPLPSVSVIMAVYNGERYVAEAVESVLGQTHGDFEFIIVNDGSTDRTRAILNGYAARDGRIRVIDQANVDQPASLNRALRAASNDWVAVLDADDVCMPHRLEAQLRALRRLPSVHVLGSYAIWIDDYGRERGVRAAGPTSESEFESSVAQNERIALVHPSAMMHRPTILSLGGYDANFGAAADTELWSRVSDEHKIISLPEPLLYYRVHPASMSVGRFFEQQLMLRWIQARQYARRQRISLPTLEEYRMSKEGRSTVHRLNRTRKDWGQYFETRSRLARWRGNYLRAVLLLLIALTLDPPLGASLWHTAKRNGKISLPIIAQRKP